MSRRLRTLVWVALLAASCVVLVACRQGPAAPLAAPPTAAGATDQAQPAPRGEAAPSWAASVVPLPETPPPSAAEPPEVLAATIADHEYDRGAADVPARHLVYRVAFIVPPELRGGRPALAAPAGELHIDVSRERLRARFVGPGWPVDEGTEVRLRGDVPGVYLFDGSGGRPLPPGQLAAWFQGREGGRTKGGVHVRRESGSSGDVRGELVCALLAEWTRQARDDVMPRCVGGPPVPAFRFGLWAAELTAAVPLSLPASRLRADSGDPPPPINELPSRAILEPSELARLPASHMHADPRLGTIDPSLTSGALDVDNDSDARIIVIAQGVPIGWVRAHSHGHFDGFTPGFYYVGAVRPFGQPALHAGLVRIPGSVRTRR